MDVWPERSLPYWCYGNFLAYEDKDISTAESHLRKAIEIDPKDEICNYNLGKHLLYWGRTDEAKKYLRHAARKGHSKAQERLQEMARNANRKPLRK